MSKLKAKQRHALKKSQFGLPAQRKYPMPDKTHAIDAKARAKEELDKGHISKAQYDHIVAKANEVIKEHGS